MNDERRIAVLERKDKNVAVEGNWRVVVESDLVDCEQMSELRSLLVDVFTVLLLCFLGFGAVALYEEVWAEPALLLGGGFFVGLVMGFYVRQTGKK